MPGRPQQRRPSDSCRHSPSTTASCGQAPDGAANSARFDLGGRLGQRLRAPAIGRSRPARASACATTLRIAAQLLERELRSPRGGPTRRAPAPGRPPRRRSAASRLRAPPAPTPGAGSRARRGSAPPRGRPTRRCATRAAAAPGRGGTRGEQRRRQLQRVRHDDVVVGEPVDQQQRPVRLRRRGRTDASSAVVELGVLRRVAEVALGVGRVVEVLVGDRAPRRPPRGTRRVAAGPRTPRAIRRTTSRGSRRGRGRGRASARPRPAARRSDRRASARSRGGRPAPTRYRCPGVPRPSIVRTATPRRSANHCSLAVRAPRTGRPPDPCGPP